MNKSSKTCDLVIEKQKKEVIKMELLFIICVIAVWILYHKIFNVYYFNLVNGLLWELMGCTVGGFLLMWLISEFWFIALIIVALGIAYTIYKKKEK